MKLKIAFLLVTTSIILSTITIPVKAQETSTSKWRVIEVDADGGSGPIGVDSNGIPHIVYMSAWNGATYATFDGTSWDYEIIRAGPWYPRSLAIDGNDAPHISFVVAEMGTTHCGYGNKTSANWNFTYVNNTIECFANSLDVNEDGKDVQVLYATVDGLNYAKLVNYSFVNETVDTTSVWKDSYVNSDKAIKIGKNGYPQIAYFVYETSTDRVIDYANFEGSVWNKTEIYRAKQGGGSIAIDLDSNSTPHIVYGTDHNAEYSTWNGSDWINETAVGSGYDTSIDLDNNQMPHISCIDHHDTNHAILKYAYKNKTIWVTESIDIANNVSEQMKWTSIAMDKYGYAHIAYTKKNSGLWYATNKPVVNEITTILGPSIILISLFIVAMKRKKKIDKNDGLHMAWE